MRRHVLILFFFAVFSAGVNAEVPAAFYIESEYKNDSIDYSETEQYFYRGKLSVLFSEESSLNFGYVYVTKEEEKRHTWSLVLNDISPYFTFIAGNYYVNFGYGLLAGRKMAFEPDIFSNRTGEDKHNLFIPCKSGNPLYSFNGIAASCFKKIMDISASLNLFYSINERFIDSDSYESESISSGMAAIDGRDDKAYNSCEPVDISTTGGLLSLRAMDAFTLQLFYIFIKIGSEDKSAILWDSYDNYYGEYGTSKLLGSGFLLQYSDDFINIFCEGDMTAREIIFNNDKKESVKGYGLLYGISFTPPFLRLSLTGKQMDNMFYSPYSSSFGNDSSEDAFFFVTEVRPFINLKIGSALSSQRKTGTGSRDDAAPVTEREKIYVNYNYGPLDEFSVAARRVEISGEDGRAEKYQLKENAAVKLFKSIRLEASSIYQRSGSAGHSDLYEGGIETAVHSSIKIAAFYASARISENNYIYAVISPVPNSNTPGITIKKNSNIIISKIGFKYKKIVISCRYLYQYHNSAVLHRRLEFCAFAKF